ncbi:H/ACA ribonucleoprotein complex non-core subunit NAF1 [Leguminivora glycinivorella]|uniref:H/ACA ribonucleoprotein complex non-core subunit NAF1 n=1 Tax=Leguminivora glycinivorella TaxID=1035111 RepID=UPI00200C96C2|nr:H/ACA ribonucleoprotein complex non-core subunit NAF1 [Leguminivora glycinivorella]
MENLNESNNKNVSLSLIAEYGTSDSDSDDTETRSNNTNDSDAAELSEMVLKNNIINACAHGPLSRPSAREEVEKSRHMIIDSSESGVVEYEVTEYREDSDSDSDSSSDSSDSDVDSVKDVLEELSSSDETETARAEKAEPPRVQGELGFDDLPPIEDLAISLPAQEMTKIGTIASIVDRLVQVTEPHYCVRFNSQEHVRERGVQAGADVFIAPASQHTSYVFLAELMKVKGSDASWLNDIEPPPHQVEYSDDEEERRAKKASKEQKQKPEDSDGETSKRKPRNQRPSESSSRFGSGPSRGRNPFASRRAAPHRAWPTDRAPPPPPDFMPPFPPFNPAAPPPFMPPGFMFGGAPRMAPAPPALPPFRHAVLFGASLCGNRPQWTTGPPPPPGT